MNQPRTERPVTVDEDGKPLLPCGISRDDAKRRTARAWDRALRACGAENETVANSVGVSDTRIRKQRSDDQKDLDVLPSIVDWVLVDSDIASRFLIELAAEREAIHGGIPQARVVQAVSKAMVSASTFSVTGARSLEDGVIEHTEIPQLDAHAAEGIEALEELRAIFRGTKGLIR
jgi:hypothetical protein